MMSTGRRRKLPISATVTAVATLMGALATVAGVVVAVIALRDDDSEPEPVGASVEELAKATVNIQAVQTDGTFVWGGSGSIIRSDGLIVTAAHLVEDRLGEYDRLEIAVTDRVYAAPEWKYRAKTAAVDYALDLAVLKVESDINGKAVLDINLPFVDIGDSDAVEILDEIRVLGFPSVGATP